MLLLHVRSYVFHSLKAKDMTKNLVLWSVALVCLASGAVGAKEDTTVPVRPGSTAKGIRRIAEVSEGRRSETSYKRMCIICFTEKLLCITQVTFRPQ